MLIIGCGGLGRQVARLALLQGQTVTGVVHTTASAALLEALGICAQVMDLDVPPLPQLSSAGTKMFYFAPPPEQGSTDPRLAAVLRTCERDGLPQRCVYVSTTGVYGDCGGAWVDETWPARPSTERSQRRWDAEQQLMAWAARHGIEWVILRVAGIYGAGRLPLARIRQGLPVVHETESAFSNRIHAADLAQVCIAAMQQPVAGEVFNVSDGHPSTMTTYFDAVADWARLPRPPRITLNDAAAQLSPAMRSYLQESRRLDNRKLLERLGINLRFPQLADGLSHCTND